MNLVERMEAVEPAGFDYGQMAQDTAAEAQAVAERYRARSKAYFMDTGRDLLAIKDRLEHGLFLRWVEAEMGLTPRTAQNFMQAAAQLGHKSEIVSHLPPTTLYKLSAPSTPEPVREQVLRRLEAGEALSAKQIDGEVARAREEASAAIAVEREQARRAGLTQEQRDEEDALKSRGQRRADAAARKGERERKAAYDRRQDEIAEARIGAKFLVERIGADCLSEFFDRYNHSALHRILDEAQNLAHAERCKRVLPVDVPATKFRESHGYGFDWLEPEEKAEANAIAQRISAGEPIEPVCAIAVAGVHYADYEIVEGKERFRALKWVLHRSEIPTRIAPPIGARANPTGEPGVD